MASSVVADAVAKKRVEGGQRTIARPWRLSRWGVSNLVTPPCLSSMVAGAALICLIRAYDPVNFVPPSSLISPPQPGSYPWLQAAVGVLALSMALLKLTDGRGAASEDTRTTPADQPGRLLCGLLQFAQNRRVASARWKRCYNASR